MESSSKRLFDSHMHIIDPRFSLIPNQGYLPEYFTCEDYRARTAEFTVVGGVIVSGSFQGTDQTYLLDALMRLGPGFVGVTQLPTTASDEQILALHAAGVRAIRFNLRRGGSAALQGLETMAQRVFDLVGWHAELYVDGRDLLELESRIRGLPKVSIDHLGVSKEGFTTLLRLVDTGVYVKASGFGRVDFPVPETLKAIHSRNPAALLFGTDLPSPRAPRPFRDTDVALVVESLGELGSRQALCENAMSFYGVNCTA